MTLHTPPLHDRARRRPALAALAALLVTALMSACAAAPDEPDGVEIPATPVGEQAAWVVGQLNAEEVADEPAIAERFDPDLFATVSLGDLRTRLDDLRSLRPWTVATYEGTDAEAVARIEADSAQFDLQVSVDDEGRMNGLFFAQPRPERTPAADWEELRDRLRSEPFDISLHVIQADSGASIESVGDSGTAPVGSIVKLYVLGALVDAIAEGALGWDSVLTVDPEVRSLPTGELQDLPDGATVSVLEAAQKMIAISDNTATDLLIRAVGRDAVSAAMVEMGHHDPSVNSPLLTTREFFWIGWGDAELRERWADADEPGRAALLAEVPTGIFDPQAADWSEPAWRSDVDWFADAFDIVAAHRALQEKATTEAGGPVRDILSANTVIPLSEEWTYAGFKGGSSTGVLAGSWYLERAGESPLVVVLLARSEHPAALADTEAIFGHAEDAARLLTED